MCDETIQVPETSRGQTIECPACGSYIETTSGGGPSGSAASDSSIPSGTDEDQYEEESDVPEEGEGVDRRLMLVISGIAAVVVVGLIILVTVILPSGSRQVEESAVLPRQEVVDTDLRSRSATSETQPTEPIVQERPQKDISPIKSISLENANKIAFVSDRDGNYEIYVMNEDGNGLKRLTNNHDEDVFPCWSPDGRKIAFESRRDGNPEIYVMNADGTEQTNLTRSTSGEQDPSWSPDGQKIAFHSLKDENHEICVMNADGSELKRLTNNRTHDMSPSWSPDGMKIVFHSLKDENHEIYVMNADGSGQMRLTNNPAFDRSPAWSPDGKTIAFVSNRDKYFDIYVMNADGNEQKKLTNHPASGSNPSWSSDGKKIAFVSNRDGNREIYAMNADGSEQKRLSNNPAEDRFPCWLPIRSSEAEEKSQKEESLPTVQYKLKFEKGQSYYVRVISDSNSVQEVEGQVIISDVTSCFGYSFDVSEVDENGNGWVDCTVDWIKLRQKTPPIDVVYDSSKKPSRVPTLAQRNAGFLGESFSVKMTPQGQVEELRGLEKLRKNMEKKIPEGRMKQQMLQTLEEQQLADFIKDALFNPMAVYPDKPVGIGDSWSRTGFLSSRQSFILENKWTLQDRKAGIAIIEASAAIKSKPDAVQKQDVKVKYDMSGKQAGQIEIKESTGQIIYSKMTQDLSGQTQVDDMAIRTKSHAVTTFEMTERKD
jgi:Tol biopolymer transport system component